MFAVISVCVSTVSPKLSGVSEKSKVEISNIVSVQLNYVKKKNRIFYGIDLQYSQG